MTMVGNKDDAFLRSIPQKTPHLWLLLVGLLVLGTIQVSGPSAAVVLEWSSVPKAKNTSSAATLVETDHPIGILRRLLQTRYPECRLPTDWNGRFNLKEVGKYAKVASSTSINTTAATPPVPLYDHVSCWVMKARYNCAYRPGAPFVMPYDYELVLKLAAERPCKLRSLIDDTLLEWSAVSSAGLVDGTAEPRRPPPTPATRTKYGEAIHHVLLQGNSYVRQLWEALVCGISSHHRPHGLVSQVVVQLGGPGVSITDMVRRGNTTVPVTDLGIPLSNWSDLQVRGCHGDPNSDIASMYRRRAVVPPNLPNCNDDIASIRVGQWRFSYIFKPTMYSQAALQAIYHDRFGITPDDSWTSSSTISETTDGQTHPAHPPKYWLVWNFANKEPQTVTPPGLAIPPSRTIAIESWLWTLKGLQATQLGKYFGANNPFVHPPDDHACLPGPPDDQVHLLLYLMWSGYRIVE